MLGFVLYHNILGCYGFDWSAARDLPVKRPERFDDWAADHQSVTD